MTEIFNETPIRQGRRFFHYGKDFETVKRQFTRFIFREELIGATIRAKWSGLHMVANAGKYGVLGQIIAKITHRDEPSRMPCLPRRLNYARRRECHTWLMHIGAKITV